MHLIDADEKEIMLVCHSYGGIPGRGAGHGLIKIARAKEEKKGGVTGMRYISGFLVPE